jgi:hypothetical protein
MATIPVKTTPQVIEEGVYHIMEDGTVFRSRISKEVGETHRKPNPPHQITKVKFANVTNEDYTIIRENADTIHAQWEKKKARILAARTGWNSVSQANAMKELHLQFVGSGEPLMAESFFLALKMFK